LVVRRGGAETSSKEVNYAGNLISAKQVTDNPGLRPIKWKFVIGIYLCKFYEEAEQLSASSILRCLASRVLKK
jgi:hypothetical protein